MATGTEALVLNGELRLAKAVIRTGRLYSCRAFPKEFVKGRIKEFSKATLNTNIQLNILEIAEAGSQVHSYAMMSWKRESCPEVATLMLTVCVTSASASL